MLALTIGNAVATAATGFSFDAPVVTVVSPNGPRCLDATLEAKMSMYSYGLSLCSRGVSMLLSKEDVDVQLWPKLI